MDSLPPPTRRELLQRGGLLAGALVVGSWGTSSAAAAPPAVAVGLALSEERRRVYMALAERAVTGPGMQLPAAAAEQVLADFEVIYAGWPTPERRQADTILDALSRDPKFETRGQLAYRARGLILVALSSDQENHVEVSF